MKFFLGHPVYRFGCVQLFNLALIILKIFLVNLKIDTSFVGIGPLRKEIKKKEIQICTHSQTRALAFWPRQIFEGHV